MKVVVLGGAGSVGAGTVEELIKAHDVEQVLIADISEEAGSRILKQFPSKKCEFRKVDISRIEAILPLIEGKDVVANCAWYYHNLEVMEACIQGKVHYLDAGGLYHLTTKQLELHHRAEKAGIIAALGYGIAPGITNICSSYCAKRLDQVDSIHIRIALFPEDEKFWEVFYALPTVLDELFMEAPVFELGEMKMVPPLSRNSKVVFADPVGEVTLYDTLHSELATLPNSFKEKGIREVRFQLGWSPIKVDVSKMLMDLGFADESPLDINGGRISPREFLSLVANAQGMTGFVRRNIAIRIHAHGSKDGIETSYVISRTGVPAGISVNLTGLAVAIGALLIGRGQISARGVVPSERSVDPDLFLQELRSRGLEFEETIETIRPLGL